jgi:hypothetical protein
MVDGDECGIKCDESGRFCMTVDEEEGKKEMEGGARQQYLYAHRLIYQPPRSQSEQAN